MASDHTAALKIPQFWPKRSELWFAQVNIRKTTSDLTKYSYVVVALDEDTATRVLDILTQPPATHKYITLKDRLGDTFRRNDREAEVKEELGDSKPSELMDKMLEFVPPGESPFLFRDIFFCKLSHQVQALVTQTKIKDLQQLAKLADKHFLSRETTHQQQHIRFRVSGNICTCRSLHNNRLSDRERILESPCVSLQSHYPDILQTYNPPRSDTHHHPHPVHSRALRLSPDNLTFAMAEFDNMEAFGIVFYEGFLRHSRTVPPE
uniref:DUF7041 domain-containing protein n=1 Tax=Octopus bimaculoides TaxID=37653 RepID=A0A0L8HHI7_OCTBM